jgi:hypothetical protein
MLMLLLTNSQWQVQMLHTLGRVWMPLRLQRSLVSRCGWGLQVAGVRIRDALRAEGPGPAVHPEQAACDPFSAVDGECAPEAAVLLKGVMLRAAFGGMAGDIEMLNEFTAVWRRRCNPYHLSLSSSLIISCVPTCVFYGPPVSIQPGT